MSDLHMIHALTWSNSFDLQERLLNAKEEILKPLGWDNIDDEVILKVCKGLRGLNLYKTEPTKLSDLLKDDPDLLADAVHAVAFAANWFKECLSIEGPNEIPYTFQIVFVALTYRMLNNSMHSEVFSHWFWFTTYSEAFSGMSDDRVNRALRDFKKMISMNRPVWSDRKKVSFGAWRGDRFDFRSVRTKAILLNFARRILHETGYNAFSDLRDFGRGAAQMLISRIYLNKKYSSLGNRLLLSPSDAINFRHDWQFGGGLTIEDKRAHFLPMDFDWGNPEAGVEKRAAEIEEYILNHIEFTAIRYQKTSISYA